MTGNRDVKDRQRKTGAAIAGAGGATAGIGLVAGGVPGTRSDINPLLNPGERVAAPKTQAHSAGRMADRWRHATKGGILSLRTHAHEGGIWGFSANDKKNKRTGGPKTPADAFLHGKNQGKIKPEYDIVRHMKAGRKVAHGALVGGAAATAYGAHQYKKGSVKKSRDQKTGDAGAAAVGAGGTLAVAGHGTKKLFQGQDKKWRKVANESKANSKKAAGRYIGSTLAEKKPHALKDIPMDSAYKAGQHAGLGAQANHFSHVYGNTAKVMGHVRNAGLATAAVGGGAVAVSHKSKVHKAKPLISDAEIRRRKKVQSRISQTTGALGLAALGGTLAASRPGRNALRRIPKMDRYVAKPPPKDPNRDRIKSAVTPLLATSAGLGGLGSFNFAAYTNAESRKRGPVKKDGYSAFGVDHTD